MLRIHPRTTLMILLFTIPVSAEERLDHLREHGSKQHAFSPRDAVAAPS